MFVFALVRVCAGSVRSCRDVAGVHADIRHRALDCPGGRLVFGQGIPVKEIQARAGWLACLLGVLLLPLLIDGSSLVAASLHRPVCSGFLVCCDYLLVTVVPYTVMSAVSLARNTKAKWGYGTGPALDAVTLVVALLSVPCSIPLFRIMDSVG